MSHYFPIDDSILDEIIKGTDGEGGKKAEHMIDILDSFSTAIASMIESIKKLFSAFSGAAK